MMLSLLTSNNLLMMDQIDDVIHMIIMLKKVTK